MGSVTRYPGSWFQDTADHTVLPVIEKHFCNSEFENVILQQRSYFALCDPLFAVCLVLLLSFFFQCCVEFNFQQLVNGASGKDLPGEVAQELNLALLLKASFQLASHTS